MAWKIWARALSMVALCGVVVPAEAQSLLPFRLTQRPGAANNPPQNGANNAAGPTAGVQANNLPGTPVVPSTAFGAPAPAAPADPTTDPLRAQVVQAIQVTSQRYLTANVHTPWQIFHGILALHQNFLLKLSNEKISAIEWIATSNPYFDGQPLIVHTQIGGKFHSFTRPYAFEGHPAQFLALLSESNLPTTYAFQTPQKPVTIADMLRTAQAEVNTREEITWVLWSLNHYLPPDAAWTNQAGEAWSIERLVQIQNAAVVEKAACGGNHGLFALSRARDTYLATGRPLGGAWLDADQKIRRYIEIARSMQNPDGSFSANFYQGPKYTTDLNSRLNTTGHTFEFLSVGLAKERLNEYWVRNAAAALSKDLIDNRKAPTDCGPLYHSLNALKIYAERTWPGSTALPPPENVPVPAVAGTPPKTEATPVATNDKTPSPASSEKTPVPESGGFTLTPTVVTPGVASDGAPTVLPSPATASPTSMPAAPTVAPGPTPVPVPTTVPQPTIPAVQPTAAPGTASMRRPHGEPGRITPETSREVEAPAASALKPSNVKTSPEASPPVSGERSSETSRIPQPFEPRHFQLNLRIEHAMQGRPSADAPPPSSSTKSSHVPQPTIIVPTSGELDE